MSAPLAALAPVPPAPTFNIDTSMNANMNVNVTATETKPPEKAPEPEKTATPSATSRLEAQIEQLQSLATRLRAVRTAPTRLVMQNLPGTLGMKMRSALGEIEELRGVLLSTEAQEALSAAAASEKADRSGLKGGLRREIRKRK